MNTEQKQVNYSDHIQNMTDEQLSAELDHVIFWSNYFCDVVKMISIGKIVCVRQSVIDGISPIFIQKGIKNSIRNGCLESIANLLTFSIYFDTMTS
jgi:hypothetical protein